LIAPRVHSFVPVSFLSHWSRFARYAVVGGSGVAVNTLVLFVLVARVGMPHVAAAVVSSEVSVLSNFLLNDLWTFRDSRAGVPLWRRAVHYNAVALAGMVMTVTVLLVLTEGAHVHYLIANLIAIAAATLSNYALNSRFTWAIPGAEVGVLESPA
jgi:putative flippase GtrA